MLQIRVNMCVVCNMSGFFELWNETVQILRVNISFGFHMLQHEWDIAYVGCSKHMWFEQVLRALPAETMVDGLPRVSSGVGSLN